MDLNGNYVLDESITKSESVGVEVTPEAKVYEGFKTPDGKEIGRTTKLVYYDSDVRGSEIGDDKTDNKYYPQYKYANDTSAKVTTEGAVVY